MMTGVATLAAMVMLAASPRADDRNLIVVYAPWTTPAQALDAAAAAGGRLLGFPGPAFVVAVEAESPDFVARAKAGGALLILAARTTFGCSSGATGRAS